MSSRKELKERRRREREEAERRAQEQARRRRRLRLYAALGAAAAALAVGAAVVAFDGGDDPKEVFSAKPEGLGEPLQKARRALGTDHFHPTIRVVANGEQIPVPDDVGAGEGTASTPLHRHPGDEQLRAEGPGDEVYVAYGTREQSPIVL